MHNQLIDVGLVHTANWQRSDHGRVRPDKLDFPGGPPWLYAFVTGDAVKYVAQTINSVVGRFDQYAYMSDDHHRRIREAISSELEAGRPVEIWTRPNVDMSMIDEIEMSLLHFHKPAWNEPDRS